jgi:hypothetical protein
MQPSNDVLLAQAAAQMKTAAEQCAHAREVISRSEKMISSSKKAIFLSLKRFLPIEDKKSHQLFFNDFES